MSMKVIRASALMLAMLFLAGCAEGNLATYEVAGTVKFQDGTHPKFGDIEFYCPSAQVNARGKIARDGTFTVSTFEPSDGAVEGHHDIIIMQQVGHYLLADSKSTIRHDHGSLIDASYFDYRTSNLSCEIAPGVNEVALVVRKRPRQTKEGTALPSH